MSSGSYLLNVPKLKGRENYDDWAFAARNFLILEGIDIDAIPVDLSHAEDRKAKAKLVMTIDPKLYVSSICTSKMKPKSRICGRNYKSYSMTAGSQEKSAYFEH